MKYLILGTLVLGSLSAIAQDYTFGLYDMSLSRNLDANDGVCSTKKTTELHFDLYSLTSKGLASSQSRVYGEARIDKFNKNIRVGSDAQDWNLKTKRPLNIDRNGNFQISVVVKDSDYCGVGAWAIGRLSLNKDKTLEKKIISGSVKDLNFKNAGDGKCRALLPLNERGSNSIVDARIEILKDC